MNAEACQVFDFPPRKTGDLDWVNDSRDTAEDGGVDDGEKDMPISLSDKAQSLSAEAMDLVVAGLSMIFWSWSRDRITFHFLLPDSFLDYRDKHPRRLAHVRAAFGRIRSIMTPAIVQEMSHRMELDAAHDRRCAEFQPLCLKKVVKVEVLEQSGQIRVEYITEVGLHDLGFNDTERISVVRQSRVNAAAFADCQYTFACN